MKSKKVFKKFLVISLNLMIILSIFSGFSLAQEGDIPFGCIMDLSGALGHNGPYWLRAGEIVVEEINNTGGILGRKIKLIVEDGETNVEAGIMAARKLISINQVIAIFGPTSNIVVGIMDYCAENKVPLISGVSGSSRLDDTGGKYQYRTAPSDSYEGLVNAHYTYNELGIKRVSIMIADEEGTMSVGENFKKAFVALGGEVLKEVIIAPGQATYQSAIALAYEPEPEAIMLSADQGATATVIKENVRGGYKGKIIAGSDIGETDDFLDLVGRQNLEGVSYTQLASDPNTVSFKSYAQKWNAFPRGDVGVGPMHYGVPNSYDAMVIFCLAMQAAGEVTGEGIAENVRNVANPPGVIVHSFTEGKEQLLLGNEINYEGASGPCDFNEYGNVAGGFSKWEFDSEGKGHEIKYYPPGSLE